MKWLSNVRETYGYLSAALGGQPMEHGDSRPTHTLDGSVVPRVTRERFLADSRAAAQSDLIVSGMSELSQRSGGTQWVTHQRDAALEQLEVDHLLLAPLAISADTAGDPLLPQHWRWHQAVYQQSEHRAVVLSPVVYGTLLAAEQQRPRPGLVDLALDLRLVQPEELAFRPPVEADGMLIPGVGVLVAGPDLQHCLLRLGQIERWCQIAWFGRRFSAPGHEDDDDIEGMPEESA